MILKYLSVLFVISASAQIPSQTVDYYVKLIQECSQEAFSKLVPENSYDFRPVSENTTYNGTFDYIIVGAGSAGAVIATRLSEREDLNILLLEAGGDENDFTDIPGMMSYLPGLRFNWNFKTVPQRHSCLGLINKQYPYARGKALGGSSVINGLMYTRGNRHDYDSWEKSGNPGWSYRDVLRYFMKSENSQIDGDKDFHGKGGLLNVEYIRPYSPVYHAFIEANLQLGRKFVDYNGEEQLGVGNIQRNTLKGKRHSTGRAFLARAANRHNLKILTNTLATKILIKDDNREAYGVQFTRNKAWYKAFASKEVIVSAGAVGSPQLLMLSGIGPANELKKHQIPLVQNLAVGENLHDHVGFNVQFNSDVVEPVKSVKENAMDYLDDYGPFTVAQNTQGVGFYQTNLTNIEGVPDLEVLCFLPDVSNTNLKNLPSIYTNETYNAVTKGTLPAQTFSPCPIALHPKSRGTITLTSSDPFDYPLIDPNYLSDEDGDDIETLYAGIQLILEMVHTRAFEEINTQLVDGTLPACKQHEYLSKAYWYCQIRHLAIGTFHAAGTCKMGPHPSEGDVVNHELKVHGVKNLRVADASIMPTPISGHTNAVVIMIGEKAADMLLNDS